VDNIVTSTTGVIAYIAILSDVLKLYIVPALKINTAKDRKNILVIIFNPKSIENKNKNRIKNNNILW